jgi:hypothetical protein
MSRRAATSAQVSGFPGGTQLGYRTRDDAQAAWEHAQANHTVGQPPTSTRTVTRVPSAPPYSIVRTPPPSPTPAPRRSGSAPALTPPRSGRAHSPPVVHAQGAAVPIGHLFPQLQVPRSPSPDQAVPSAPSRLGRSQPLPSVPSTPGCHTVVLTRRSPATPRFGLSDEAAYWVVTSGANPGVYRGK